MENTEVKVKQTIANLDFCRKSFDDLSVTDSLQYDLGMDSLAAIELLVALEENFTIVIVDEEILEQDTWMQTIGSLVRFIEQKLQKRML